MVVAVALGLTLAGVVVLALAGLGTFRKVRALGAGASDLAGWLRQEGARLEREGALAAAAFGELSLRLQLLQRRLSPTSRLLASPLVAEGIRWTLRRLWGKPFKRGN